MLLWISALASASAPFPCGTGALLPGAPPLARVAGATSGGALLGRDAYGVPNERRSEHFAVRWGEDQGPLDEDALDALLDSFELAWEVQVEDYGHVAPESAAVFLFNVYIGDTGDGTLGSFGNGGYYYVDDEGYPLVVVSYDSLVGYGGAYAHHVAIHEWYHALQDAAQRYPYYGLSAWYWEATAEWSTYETDPADTYNGIYGWAYLMQPQYPQQFFDYPDTGAITEYRQYGAYLLPRWITLLYGPEVVRDSWTVPGLQLDPLEVLRGALADQGVNLTEVWLDHLAANATFDLPDGDNQEFLVDFYEGYYDSDRITREVDGSGRAGSVGGPAAPFRYGSAAIHLTEPEKGTLRAEVVGDPQGTEGSPAQWGARLAVVHADGVVDTLAVPFDGGVGTVEFAGLWVTDEAWLVVGAWTEDNSTWVTEQFEFDWSLTVFDPDAAGPETPPVDEAERGCGCQTSSTGGAAWLGLAGVAAWRRRRAPPPSQNVGAENV